MAPTSVSEDVAAAERRPGVEDDGGRGEDAYDERTRTEIIDAFLEGRRICSAGAPPPAPAKVQNKKPSKLCAFGDCLRHRQVDCGGLCLTHARLAGDNCEGGVARVRVRLSGRLRNGFRPAALPAGLREEWGYGEFRNEAKVKVARDVDAGEAERKATKEGGGEAASVVNPSATLTECCTAEECREHRRSGLRGYCLTRRRRVCRRLGCNMCIGVDGGEYCFSHDILQKDHTDNAPGKGNRFDEADARPQEELQRTVIQQKDENNTSTGGSTRSDMTPVREPKGGKEGGGDDDVSSDNIIEEDCWTCDCGNVVPGRKLRCGNCHHWLGGKRRGGWNHDKWKLGPGAFACDGIDRTQDWECCGAKISARQTRCGKCNKWRGGKRVPASVSVAAAPPPAGLTWECGKCNMSNPGSKTRCGGCLASKPPGRGRTGASKSSRSIEPSQSQREEVANVAAAEEDKQRPSKRARAVERSRSRLSKTDQQQQQTVQEKPSAQQQRHAPRENGRWHWHHWDDDAKEKRRQHRAKLARERNNRLSEEERDEWRLARNARRREQRREKAKQKKLKEKEEEERLKEEEKMYKFTCTSCSGDAGHPTLKGFIGLSYNSDRDNLTECGGYLVSVSPDHEGWAVIVLDIPGRGRVPCLCPASKIDDPAIKAAGAKARSFLDHKTRMNASRASAESVSVTSTPARRSDIEGHLLLSDPDNVRGRVVDSDMLSSLQMGCLRTMSQQSHYTLDRRFAVRRERLMNTAQMIVTSNGFLTLRPADRSGVEVMARLGHEAIRSRMRFHKNMSKAICRLDEAGGLGPPTLEEKLLQLSTGGDTESMNVGRFLPCRGLCGNPNVKVRCACGFVVDEEFKSSTKLLLRRRCNRIASSNLHPLVPEPT